MKSIEKYNKVRHELKNGDVILFRGDSVMSKLIQWGDSVDGQKAYYNHAGLAVKLGSRFLIIDSNAPGVRPEFLSKRINEYNDFCVLRINNGFTQSEIDSCVNRVLDKVESQEIKYEFSLLPKIAIFRKFGIKLKFNDKENRDICSMFVGDRLLIQQIGLECMKKAKEKQGYLTPQDLIRFSDNSLSVLFNDFK